MDAHSHNFVETYQGLVGFGADRETDENTVIYYLQKFSDDKFMQTLIKRMSAAELAEIFDLINRYIAHIKLNNKSWRSKETHLKAFARFMKDKNLSAITLQDCQNFHKQLIEKPITKTKYMKRSTVNRYFSTIKHMFNRAID